MSLINFIHDVDDLSCVQRFSQVSLTKGENVLEHSGFVALVSLYIGEVINKYSDSKIDMGILLSKSLLHDFDEIATGDIARPVKYRNKDLRESFAKVESEIMLEISSKYLISENVFKSWSESKFEIEGAIVALSDCISALYKFHSEIVCRGNLKMGRKYNSNLLSLTESKIKNILDNLGENAWQVENFFLGISNECRNLSIEIKRIGGI